ncbi:MAG TPA: asparagine synthase (glutamine-hydrolyzing) [Syntrophobacteraceae bacterium]|nr:asparagine synthase (glutamine-hydrolyzing) [Syntrophobacteraceae bacterium]
MCGIVGIISPLNQVGDKLHKAEAVQKHRGPDSRGRIEYRLCNLTVGLAHQRLSILDVSEAGSQPMKSPDGKGVIVFNGEVYNYRELREELAAYGYGFQSDSDTEVVLAALHRWGPEEALPKFNGMWSFAWLDVENRRLVLSRDRAGKKPLYYYSNGSGFYFASEIKTLLEMSPAKFSLNHQAVAEYLDQSLLDTGEKTFFDGILKVPAASWCAIDLSSPPLKLEFRHYWDLPSKPAGPTSEKESTEYLRALFIDSVRLRLRSDVPVGLLLSGGIDSSSIAAAMRCIVGRDALNLLSAVSADGRYDESPFIDRMEQHLGVRANKVVLDFKPEQAIDYLYQACWHNDEPVGSFSNVAHFLLMREAKRLGITVILSGQGADELLCGYRKYLGFYLQHLASRHEYFKAAKVCSEFLHQGTIISQFSVREAKRYLPSALKPSEPPVLGSALCGFRPQPMGMSANMTVQERQALDLKRFSVPILTHYEDRMSMAWSREIRLPFLDYRIMDFLVPLAMERKLNKGWTKFILRKAMEPFLPPDIVWRKDKQGFLNPEAEWLKKYFRTQVEEYFSPESMIFKKHLVNRRNLLRKYEIYCSQKDGKGNIWSKDIFNPLALEVWLRRFEAYIS